MDHRNDRTFLYTKRNLHTCEQKVVMITGWIDGVIFHKPRAVDAEPNHNGTGTTPPFLVPEVLLTHLDSVSQIRTATKTFGGRIGFGTSCVIGGGSG